jgi:nitrite reductase/ring-hydroxylating ferredoxin subunit
MRADSRDVYVICAAASIERGDAKAFSLSRLDESGEARPFPLFVVRTERDDFIGYVNSCPHEGVWLNFGDGQFFAPHREQLECGRHGAKFEIESGICVEGPCKGLSLEPVAIAVIDGDLCVCGVALVEDDGMPNPFEEFDDTMEIMIHPD